MAQRARVRPISFALSSARTQRFVRPFSTVLDTPIDPQTQQATPPAVRKSSVFEEAVNATGTRTNWTREEIAEIYNTPLIRLTYAAVCLTVNRPVIQF
jgi:biotin synthase